MVDLGWLLFPSLSFLTNGQKQKLNLKAKPVLGILIYCTVQSLPQSWTSCRTRSGWSGPGGSSTRRTWRPSRAAGAGPMWPPSPSIPCWTWGVERRLSAHNQKITLSPKWSQFLSQPKHWSVLVQRKCNFVKISHFTMDPPGIFFKNTALFFGNNYSLLYPPPLFLFTSQL